MFLLVIMKIFIIFLITSVFFGNVYAFEPSYVDYFSNSEFKIYKLQEKAYEFSIPYNISDAELEKIVVDCDSSALIVYLDNVGTDGNFVINIPRSLLDVKINQRDDDFIVILDQLEVEYIETNTESDSRTLDIPLRQGEKILEIIATSVGMFPEPIPCGVGDVNDSPYYRLLSPLKQFKSGILGDEIQCKENLVLIQKYDGSPACVTPETKIKLIERGWTKQPTENTITELFKQKYRTWTYSNQTTLIASDPYNQTITLFLNTNENEQIRIECMHNDWRGLEIITENVVEYFENENCYEPMLEETNSIP